MNVGDNVKVNTGINGWLPGIIVAKTELLNFPETLYNVRLDLGEFGEVVERFVESKIIKELQ